MTPSAKFSVPFFRPHVTGREETYLREAIAGGHWQGDGPFAKKCSALLEAWTGCPVYLAPSGTAALELAALSLGLNPGDEVVLPSYTFASTANAVVAAGLKPVFIDIRPDTLNLDERLIEQALSPKTKAVLPVHYAGVGCEMKAIRDVAKQQGLKIIEDAAQAVKASYDGKALGAWGDLGAFSFHQTKNLGCGEGGALVLANPAYREAVEVHRQKGTDRSKFLAGQVDKYTWVDRGSNHMLSDLLAAFLLAQLEASEEIVARRKVHYLRYREALAPYDGERFRLPVVPATCATNYHLFHLVLKTAEERERLRKHLAADGIEATTHFVPLHSSAGGRKFGETRGPMIFTEATAAGLLRIPLYTDLSESDREKVIKSLHSFIK